MSLPFAASGEATEMGTWGITTFESDDAMDWLAELEQEGSIAFLASSLSGEVEGDYLDATEGVRILCSAEVIAAAVSGDLAALPDEARSWVRKNQGLNLSPLVPLAKGRVARVLAEDSELKELWKEDTERFHDWRSAVAELILRLGSASEARGSSS